MKIRMKKDHQGYRKIGQTTYSPLHLHQRSREEWLSVLVRLEKLHKQHPESLRIKHDIEYVKEQIK